MTGKRYVSASERTKALAEGIWLWARVQNLPSNKVAGSLERRTYEEWVALWGTEMDVTARQEQYNLFDRVNAREWG